MMYITFITRLRRLFYFMFFPGYLDYLDYQDYQCLPASEWSLMIYITNITFISRMRGLFYAFSFVTRITSITLLTSVYQPVNEVCWYTLLGFTCTEWDFFVQSLDYHITGITRLPFPQKHWFYAPGLAIPTNIPIKYAFNLIWSRLEFGNNTNIWASSNTFCRI